MAFKDTIIGKWLRNEYLVPKDVRSAFESGNGINVSGIVPAAVSKYTGNSLTPAEEQTNVFNAFEAQKNRDFQERMANTQIQRQVTDMQAAGVNPGLMYGSAPSPMSTSGSTASATAPGAGLDLISAVISAFMAPLQAKQIKADTAAAGAAAQASAAAAKKSESDAALNKAREDEIRTGIGKTEEETRGLKLNNDILEVTKDVKIEAANLENKLTEAETRKAYKAMDEIAERLKLIAAQTDNEYQKKVLIQTEAALNRANRKQILEMMEYQKKYVQAQTDSARANAFLSFVNGMYQAKLIDAGYIDALVDSAAEAARRSGAEADYQLLKNRREKIAVALREGHFGYDTFGEMNVFAKFFGTALGDAMVIMDNFNPLSGVLK